MDAKQEMSRGFSEKEIAERTEVMDVLDENQDELKALMQLRGITEQQPGYAAFAINFARNKLRDRSLQNEFIRTTLAKVAN